MATTNPEEWKKDLQSIIEETVDKYKELGKHIDSLDNLVIDEGEDADDFEMKILAFIQAEFMVMKARIDKILG